jgi:AraC-like DNA-binding protein
MRYREYAALPALAGDVECVWTLAAVGTGVPPQVQRIVPDGCMELVVHLGERFSWHDGTAWTRQPSALVFGQLRQPLLLAPPARGLVCTIGVRFRPAGARSYFRADLRELAGVPTELRLLAGANAATLEERLQDAGTDHARVELLQRWLLDRQDPRGTDVQVRAATAAILRSRGAIRVDEVAVAAGLSPRHLGRRFDDAVGLGPKTLARLIRLQCAVQIAQRGASSWADVALACGYADQAHLIRDFGLLTGRSPRALLADCGDFSREILSPARVDALFGALPAMSDSSNPGDAAVV